MYLLHKIVIKADLSGFVITKHSVVCEQCVKSLGVTTSGFDFLFARAFIH